VRRLLVFMAALCLFIGGTSYAAAEEKSDQFIIINKAINQLAFYDGGKLVKTFHVSTGKQQTYTPEGTFQIVNKIKNRPYYTRNIPGGDPRNPLGDRWLGLDARGTRGDTYAIHGNSNPSTIGKYVSLGCVRMHNKDVRWLFDQVKVGTTVVITTSKLGFEEIAATHGVKPIPIEKVDTTITLLSPTKLYSKPHGVGSTGQSLAPQKVTAFEKAGDWYHIKTWFGEAWLKADEAIVGDIEIEKVNVRLALQEVTKLYKGPNGIGLTGQTLAPQEVVAFEKAGDWYHIQTWFGNAWLKADQIITQDIPIEKVNVTLSIQEFTRLYAKPHGVDPTGKVMAPQDVVAFEKAGDWYHINTWIGDAWVKAPPEAVVVVPYLDLTPQLVEEIPDEVEESQNVVSFESVPIASMDQNMQDWYLGLVAKGKATTGTWQGDLYVYLPDGQVQEVLSMDGELVVRGTIPQTYDSDLISPPPLLIKLSGVDLVTRVTFE